MSVSILSEWFTPNEAAALTDVTEKQVRKELEYGVIEASAPSQLSFVALVYLFLVRASGLRLPVEVRARLYRQLRDMLTSEQPMHDIEVSEPFYMRVNPRFESLLKRVEDYRAWKATLVEDPDIMGGSTLFPGSRLTVHHIGGMQERGIDPQEILEDYPYLNQQDLDFAQIFVRAHPKLGRPRSNA